MKRKDRALIASYLARQGAGTFRITRGGEVRAYGLMPGTKRLRWYLAGFAEHILDHMACEDAGRSYS